MFIHGRESGIEKNGNEIDETSKEAMKKPQIKNKF